MIMETKLFGTLTEHSEQENRTAFSDPPFLREIFLWNELKTRAP